MVACDSFLENIWFLFKLKYFKKLKMIFIYYSYKYKNKSDLFCEKKEIF